jgi:hypothetical protein
MTAKTIDFRIIRSARQAQRIVCEHIEVVARVQPPAAHSVLFEEDIVPGNNFLAPHMLTEN